MTTTPNEAVTAALRATMGDKRVTASELGRRLNRSHMWAARRLNGEVPLTIDGVHEIARALEVDPEPLLSASTPAVTTQ